MVKFPAGRSLYARPKSALAGNVGKPASEREQTVLTPPELVDQLRKLVNAPLALDPATVPENPLNAAFFRTGNAALGPDDCGKAANWAQLCRVVCGWWWCNPPFDDLAGWMHKARAEESRGASGYLLGPTRPHRAWFANGLPRSGQYLQLAPFAFVGSKSAFPAPLFLAAYGKAPLPRALWITSPSGRKRKNIALDVWKVER